MSASKKNEFTLSIMLVVGLVVAVSAIYLFILAMAKDGYGDNMARVKQQGDATLVSRIKPVVTLDDILGDTSSAPVVAKVASVKTGEQLFNAVCSACHSTGAAGAPKLGDSAAWTPRAEQGIDGLLASAKAGKGAMPPKGGSSYSDDEIKRVIEYMLNKAGLMDAPAAVSTDTAVPAAATTQDQPAAAAAEPAAAASSGHDLAAGEATYKTVCFACHDTGAAGAPRLGDKAAWAPRIASGYDALLNSALHGKNAMPPKGGNAALSDDQVKNIVAFMMSKAK